MKPDELKSDFKFITLLSSSVKTEIAMCLVDTGKASITFGDEKSATITCPKGEPKLMFHTHPLGTNKMSDVDIAGLLSSDRDVKDAEYCIGAMKDGEPRISCTGINIIRERNRILLSMVGL